jgi:lipoprotein signal peptidase
MKGRWLLAGLVSFDLATKFLALGLLKQAQPVEGDSTIQLVLRTNELGLGSWTQNSSGGSTVADRATAGIAMGVLGVVLLWMRRLDWSRARKIFVCAACYFFVFTIVGSWLSGVANLPLPLGVGLMRGGGATFFVCLWWMTSPGQWRLAITLLAAAGIGNFASIILPPHAVVDFIFSEPFERFLGWGVFNIADLYYLAGLVGLAIALGRAITSRVFARGTAGA